MKFAICVARLARAWLMRGREIISGARRPKLHRATVATEFSKDLHRKDHARADALKDPIVPSRKSSASAWCGAVGEAPCRGPLLPRKPQPSDWKCETECPKTNAKGSPVEARRAGPEAAARATVSA